MWINKKRIENLEKAIFNLHSLHVLVAYNVKNKRQQKKVTLFMSEYSKRMDDTVNAERMSRNRIDKIEKK